MTRAPRLAPGTRPLLIVGVVALMAWADVSPGAASPGAEATASSARVWMTTADQSQLLDRQADMALLSGSTAPGVQVRVDDAARGQLIRGFGASMTESSASLLEGLPRHARDRAYRSLFARSPGIGLSWLRQPLGSSDFALSSYTFDDTPGDVPDPALAYFSLARDEQLVLPALRRAHRLNPGLGVMLTPWSAPAWMKTPSTLAGGALQPRYHRAYADYLARSVAEYRAAGVPVEALTIANEPLNSTSAYPSMDVPVSVARQIIGDHLPAALRAAHQQVRVYGYDHNWDNTAYPLDLLADPAARSHLAGTAFHCYAGEVSAQSTVRQAHPDKEIMLSECTGGAWSDDFAANLAWNMHTLVIGGFRNGASALTLWNLALDDDGGPKGGGCQDCRGVLTVDAATGAVTRNVEYYVLGHLSRFVQPGAVRVGSSSYGTGYVESVAFLNPNGDHVLVIHNNGGTSQQVSVQQDGRSGSLVLPAGSVVTTRW